MDEATKENETGKTALFWEKGDNGDVRCTLCPRSCNVNPGETGACGARKNIDGKLVSLNYGLMCAAIDPIEKKPLFHWRPGSRILSLGTFGCNLFCPFCQNAHLSRAVTGSGLEKAAPEDVLSLVCDAGIDSAAFTYNEPSVWFEFVLETSRLLKSHGVASVLVTNGFISPDPLEILLQTTDALNIDLKGFSDETYSRLGGSLEPVLRTIFTALSKNLHVEITHLVVPGINDSLEEFEAMIHWVKEMSQGIPLHISRYFPAHGWDRPPTPLQDIKLRMDIASRHLDFVYSGNMRGSNNTFCPKCGEITVVRSPLYEIKVLTGPDGQCPSCKTPMGIVMR
ncbi:MAG: AmmeMemoRadiSam system radical SAM enzyme [Thermovirgaceae bacterium]|nr:AmmeMemoRadiSam system radical SAM enzyme [Thermovirgaceae bacterium]